MNWSWIICNTYTQRAQPDRKANSQLVKIPKHQNGDKDTGGNTHALSYIMAADKTAVLLKVIHPYKGTCKKCMQELE